MTRILKPVVIITCVLALSSLPAASFDFNPFGWGPPTRPAAPAARSVTPRPPAQVEITGAINASGAEVDDTVRIVAGLQPSAGSPLATLTQDGSWQQHARFFDRAFGELDRTQLSRVRAWSKTFLRAHRPTMFYMFSGPDFLYADAFFPEATTYVLAALEPVGQIPDLQRMPRGSLGSSLGTVSNSMHTVLSFSFFITHNMRTQLSSGRLNGTIPILYVFLARSGKTVKEVSLVNLDADGNERPESPGARSGAHGVKILFAGADGRERTLYYFSTNLANDGIKSSYFLKFCATLAPANSLIKSASYLLHSGGFSGARDFLLANSAVLVQDDSGIPLVYYNAKRWDLRPFGRYLGPIGIFPGKYQSSYAALFRKSHPIDFGIGYRWRPNESNLLMAVRTSAEPGEPAPEASARATPEENGSESKSSQPSVNKNAPARQRRARTYEAQRERSPFDWFRAISPWGRSR
jgi:hypothetical protein